jgi:N-acetylglucosamine-6-phosphate deacetylase
MRDEISMKYIVGAKIVTETRVIENSALAFDGKFRDIVPLSAFDPAGKDILYANGLIAAPGLIDLHVHGCGGRDAMEGTAEALRVISAAVAKNGVTSFLAATMTMGRTEIASALSRIRSSIREDLPGARLLGAYLEGPFINAGFKGAQNPEHIINPDWTLVEHFTDTVKITTLAPELPGAVEFIAKCRENGIIASMGHTGATYEEAAEGIRAGVSHCTHLFNAMSGIHHRHPGAAAAALAGDIHCELIADGVHVHAALFELVRRTKGIGRVVLVSDCMAAGGMGDGAYSLGGQAVSVENGVARLLDGTLAGSVAKLNRCVYNFYEHTNSTLFEAFQTASLNPARELGISGRKGSIEAGKDADFILIDGNFDVKATYVNGNCVYKEPVTLPVI